MQQILKFLFRISNQIKAEIEKRSHPPLYEINISISLSYKTINITIILNINKHFYKISIKGSCTSYIPIYQHTKKLYI